MPGSSASTGNLPATVERVLGDFLEAVKASFGQDLRSAVLYGSAAEGRLRATSDVNLVLVLERFEPAAADRLREPLRVAQAAARLSPMFLLASEVQDAAEAFAGKFSDILRRRRVLFGPDPFSSLAIPRAAALVRLRQVLHQLHAAPDRLLGNAAELEGGLEEVLLHLGVVGHGGL